MAKSTVYTACNPSTDAAFRTWGSAIAGGLLACGLVKTSDTGQINWATVTKPAAVSTLAGYEIWRFNDSLQSTAPIYIKVFYSTGASSASTGYVSFNVGTGTNGAGTLTGLLPVANSGPPATSTITVTSSAETPSFFAHGEGFMTAVINAGGWTNSGVNQVGSLLCIGRTVDATGAPTATGFTLECVRWNSTASVNYVNASHAIYATSNVISSVPVAALRPDLLTWSAGDTLYVGRHFALLPYPASVAHAFTYTNSEIGALTEATATLVGSTSHTYLALGTLASNAAADGTGSAGTNLATAYEQNACLAVIWE